jgi:hypothetical protein
MESKERAPVSILAITLKRDLLDRDIARLATHMRINKAKINKAEYALLEQQIAVMEGHLKILDLRIELHNERMENKSAP